MSQTENLNTIKTLYEAFGRGDVEAILAVVTDDVDWAADGSGPAPWYGERSTKQEVATFFGDIAGAVQVLQFDPIAFGTSDDEVYALIEFRFRAAATGREARMNLHHYFHFRDGKIDRYRGSEDSELTTAVLTA